MEAGQVNLAKLRAAWRAVRNEPSIKPLWQEYKRLALCTFGLLVLSEILVSAEIYPVKQFFDTLAAGSSTGHIDQPRVVVIAGVILTVYTLATVVRKIMDQFRHHLYRLLWCMWWSFGHRMEQRMSTDWHTAHSTGEKESIIARNIEKMGIMINDFMFDASPNAVRIVCVTIGLGLTISWHYSLLAVGTTVAYAAVVLYADRWLAPQRKLVRAEAKVFENFGTELTSHWRTLKYFGVEERFCDIHQEMLENFRRRDYPRVKRFMNVLAAQSMMLNLSRFGLFLLIGLTVDLKQGIGAAVLTLSWMERIYSDFWQLADFQRRVNDGLEPLMELADMALITPTIRQPDAPRWPADIRGQIAIRDLSFTYANAEAPALDNCSITIEPNMTVAFVGESGCGKSTLFEMAMRAHDPCGGTILLDGIPLDQLDYHRFRRELVAIVPQDVRLFDLSVMDNIRFGCDTVTAEEIQAAAAMACAHDFIMSMPQGYHTFIGENGIRVSGGQKQRLGIARALVRHPRLLVLDEATSSLDAKSQDMVQRSFDRLMADPNRGCTILIAAHRFSTVRRADLIVVMHEGRIVETGTHAELVRMNGFYNHLRELEAQGILHE